MTKKRNPRVDEISDENLLCFVRWCQLNSRLFTKNPHVVRAVLKAYAGVKP